MNPALERKFLRNQSGAVLVVGLFMLVIMAVLGGVAMRMMQLDERMAGNQRDQNLAFQAAESALRDTEAWITSKTFPFAPFTPTAFTASCVGGFAGGLCSSSLNAPSWVAYTDADWEDDAKVLNYGEFSGAANLTDLAEQPRVLLEYQGSLNLDSEGSSCSIFLLITARAVGTNPNTVVFLQSLFSLRSGSCPPVV